MSLRRDTQLPQSITVATAVGSSTAIDLTGISLPGLITPTGATAATITVHVADSEDGDYRALIDKDGTAVTFTFVAERAYELHPALFPFPWAKLTTSDTQFTGILCRKG